MKPNLNICMGELLTILKNIRDRKVTIINKKSEVYGAYLEKNASIFNKH